MATRLISGVARQVWVMWQNMRCSILFHCVPCQGAPMTWVQTPPGNSRSSRKHPGRIRRRRTVLCGRPLVGQWGRVASGPPDRREQPSAWHTKTQLLVRRRAASAGVDLSGRSSPRHHPKATTRRAGQRRRATARRERSHAQARPLLRAGRAWRAPTRCPGRAPWHMSCQQLASTVSARCGCIAGSTSC